MLLTMKKFIQILSVATLVFTLFACKKDAVAPTKTELLTAQSWKVTASEATTNGVKKDIFASFPACEKDDFITFKADKAYIEDQGTTKCDPADPQTEQGKWALTNNDTKVELSSTDSGVTITIAYDIVELTADKLVLQFTFGGTTGIVTHSKK
jgi:Lipocalin-like domain